MGVDFASAATGGVLAAKAKPTADNGKNQYEKRL